MKESLDDSICDVRLETIADRSGLDQIREIYEYSFPEEERRSWPSLIEETLLGNLDLFGIFLRDNLIGFITLWDINGFKYIEHFAIDRKMRNCGAGQKVIELLRQTIDKPLLLEAEPAGLSYDAKRRIDFYERNGFEVIDRNYIQPPYRPGLPSVPLWLMACARSSHDNIFNESRLKTSVKELHKKVYRHNEP